TRLVEIEALPASGEVATAVAQQAPRSEELEQAAGGGGRRKRRRRKKGEAAAESGTAAQAESAPVPVTQEANAHAEEQRVLCLKLASVYAGELGRVDDAVTKLQGLLERKPNDREAGEALEA